MRNDEAWARVLAQDCDEETIREVASALRSAYFQGRQDAASECRAVLDELDAKACCHKTVRTCIEHIEALDNPDPPAKVVGSA